MTKRTLDKAVLAQFTGTQEWYRHSLVRKIAYTEGAKYVAEAGVAYWLLDEIAFGQYIPRVASLDFQRWTLTVNLVEKTGVLTCDDGRGNIALTRELEFTDFPLQEIRLHFCNNIIFLPTED